MRISTGGMNSFRFGDNDFVIFGGEDNFVMPDIVIPDFNFEMPDIDMPEIVMPDTDFDIIIPDIECRE